MAARCSVGPARRRAVPRRRLGGRGIAADAGTDDCRAVDSESYPEHIRAVIFVSLISEAARDKDPNKVSGQTRAKFTTMTVGSYQADT